MHAKSLSFCFAMYFLVFSWYLLLQLLGIYWLAGIIALQAKEGENNNNKKDPVAIVTENIPCRQGVCVCVCSDDYQESSQSGCQVYYPVDREINSEA